MSDERELVAALALALSPVQVSWGWAPFESADTVPTLPIVIVQRLNFASAPYEDMCEDPAYTGDTLILIDSWTRHYEDGRALATAARIAATAAGGWRLQAESDLYDPNFRAWRIQGQWLLAGEPPL